MTATFQIIKTEFVPGFDTNTIIISNGADAALIDPNGEPSKIQAALAGKKLRAVYLTHGHFDHISAANDWGVPVYMSGADKPTVQNFSNMVLAQAGYPALLPTLDLASGDLGILPGVQCQVMNFPGHSPGQMCFLFQKEKVFLSADFIFKGGAIGRTDLPGGDPAAMNKSLERFRATDMRGFNIIPGHGPSFMI
ncbi:MAG: MBL fold metallo-hydrolase [Rickettsiales bacterium]|nr:MBL fold metallo-hydrolase [Rickettsiales bacterium]